MKRIVQLTLYPLKAPRHGGQLRCAAIARRYRQLGFEVETIAVMHDDAYRGERARNDIVLPASLPFWKQHLARFIDLQTGDCLAGDASSFAAFSALLERLRPDVLQLEQPWLYPAVRRWLDGRADAARPHLVYSSQNIEAKLKRDEMPADADPVAYQAEIRRVERLESDVARAADLVLACTAEDLIELHAMAGADREHAFAQVPNAIEPFEPDPSRVASVRQKFGLAGYPLFVGSAHPPNAEGFWQMLAPSLAILRPDEQIVVAGGVGHILRQHRAYAAWSGINEPRLRTLGQVAHDELVALIGGASVILLPITTGGGSNLKTAEAIYSGKPVLATPHALRGYGDAGRWPSVTVAANADAFRRALRELLDRPAVTPSAQHALAREEVTWTRALAPLDAAIRALFRHADDEGRPDVRERRATIGAAISRKGGVD